MGLEGVKFERFHQIATFARACGKWLLHSGDFNASPRDVAHYGDFEALGLDIILPVDLELTCTVGSGRLFTFFVVSREARALVTSCRGHPAPWGTHAPVEVTVRTDIGDLSYSSIRKPRPFERWDTSHAP